MESSRFYRDFSIDLHSVRDKSVYFWSWSGYLPYNEMIRQKVAKNIRCFLLKSAILFKGKGTQKYKLILSKSIWKTAHFDANYMKIGLVVFMPRHQKVAGYYVIPSEILSVRPSVRLSVCPSVRPSVRPAIRPSVSAHHHSCIGNSSYSLRPILLKLYRCFKDGLKICILFFQNPEIIFYHFFPIFNLDIFRALILQICKWSMYLVSATPPTVFGESF